MIAPERVTTGVPGLDPLLGGGFFPGRPYLVTGPNGSGRTLFGLQFLLEGIRKGEPVLLVAVDEPPHEILENVRSFGWDLSKIHTMDATPGQLQYRRLGDLQEIKSLHEVRSMQEMGESARRSSPATDEISIQSIYLKLRRQMEVLPARRVVIDSMTSIRHFALRASSDKQAERTEIQSLLRFLSEREATVLVTSRPPEDRELTPEQVLARGEIVLSREWHGHGTRRSLRIRRFRGSAHDGDEHPLEIRKEGLVVLDEPLGAEPTPA